MGLSFSTDHVPDGLIDEKLFHKLNIRWTQKLIVGEWLSKTDEEKLEEVVARLNKLAKKHREIDARMKKLEESLNEKKE